MDFLEKVSVGHYIIQFHFGGFQLDAYGLVDIDVGGKVYSVDAETGDPQSLPFREIIGAEVEGTERTERAFIVRMSELRTISVRRAGQEPEFGLISGVNGVEILS